jgi:hypothetical protein
MFIYLPVYLALDDGSTAPVQLRTIGGSQPPKNDQLKISAITFLIFKIS